MNHMTVCTRVIGDNGITTGNGGVRTAIMPLSGDFVGCSPSINAAGVTGFEPAI